VEEFRTDEEAQMTIWRLRVTCWIIKAKNIISDDVIFTLFLQQKWLQEHARTQARIEEAKSSNTKTIL
jgi:hypothetical protein